jgi:hypothetical protein
VTSETPISFLFPYLVSSDPKTSMSAAHFIEIVIKDKDINLDIHSKNNKNKDKDDDNNESDDRLKDKNDPKPNSDCSSNEVKLSLSDLKHIYGTSIKEMDRLCTLYYAINPSTNTDPSVRPNPNPNTIFSNARTSSSSRSSLGRTPLGDRTNTDRNSTVPVSTFSTTH